MRVWILVIVAILLLGAAARMLSKSPAVDSLHASISATEALGGTDTTGYARALGPRPFSFPRDHGPHPRFRNEWWYFTGHLATEEGHRFGYQLTFFRTALAPGLPDRTSAWATNQTYMGHFALTDIGDGTFHAFERLSRGAQGLAGARADSLRVWLEDWSLEGGGLTTFPMTLRADGADAAIRLRLDQGKPIVLQGEEGWSRKGRDPGNASYYYSFTRMPTRGTLKVNDASYEVTGTSWMDREWSTSALDPDVEGWDWLSLQLSDGSDVMLYKLRRHEGSASPYSAGVFVDDQGAATPIAWDDVDLEVLDSWESPRGSATYPSRWRLEIPGYVLDIRPCVADQEWTGSVRYWEGAVEVRGSASTGEITGDGYVELTGYAPSMSSSTVAPARRNP